MKRDHQPESTNQIPASKRVAEKAIPCFHFSLNLLVLPDQLDPKWQGPCGSGDRHREVDGTRGAAGHGHLASAPRYSRGHNLHDHCHHASFHRQHVPVMFIIFYQDDHHRHDHRHDHPHDHYYHHCHDHHHNCHHQVGVIFV